MVLSGNGCWIAAFNWKPSIVPALAEGSEAFPEFLLSVARRDLAVAENRAR